MSTKANRSRVASAPSRLSKVTPLSNVLGACGADPSSDVRELALRIIYRDPGELKPIPGSPRRHSDDQLAMLGASLDRFGFIRPLLINGSDRIIAGVGQWAAAVARGFTSVPTVAIEHLSEAEQRGYRLLDNRLSELSEWDVELRKLEMTFVADFEPELFDLGWTTPELDMILDDPGDQDSNEADDVQQVDMGPGVSRRGDLWVCGDGRVLCGDALLEADHIRLLDGELAAMVFADLPYNVPNAGHVTGRAGVREFAMAAGEMSSAEFTGFLRTTFGRLMDSTAPGATVMTCMDWRHLREILEAGHANFDTLANLCVWAKTNAGMGSLYRSQHELVLVWRRDRAPMVNNVQLGRHGRNRTNVWTYPGANSFGRSRDAELAMHPTVKPCAMVADAIKDCSKRGAIILDPFGGSGTTLIAAAKTRRRGYLIEHDPLYVDVIVRRWQKHSGKPACHADTGLTFAATAEERLSAPVSGADNAREARHVS